MADTRDPNRKIWLKSEDGCCFGAIFPNMGEYGEIEGKNGKLLARFDIATALSPGFEGKVLYAHEVVDVKMVDKTTA